MKYLDDEKPLTFNQRMPWGLGVIDTIFCLGVVGAHGIILAKLIAATLPIAADHSIENLAVLGAGWIGAAGMLGFLAILVCELYFVSNWMCRLAIGGFLALVANHLHAPHSFTAITASMAAGCTPGRYFQPGRIWHRQHPEYRETVVERVYGQSLRDPLDRDKGKPPNAGSGSKSDR